MTHDAAAAVDALYRSGWGRVVAILIGFVGLRPTSTPAAAYQQPNDLPPLTSALRLETRAERDLRN